ncbi:hypothetical protein VTN49DRAFT_6586 [Thermomyces lanuginosus]|uniref:uncharacterized protein n=1 Tax=Thermomyces lanuginosus TaxID=5541 RepID=UPI00374336B8
MIQPLLASFSSLQLRLTGCWLGNVASGVPPGRFSQLYEDSVHSGPTRVVCPERLSVKTQRQAGQHNIGLGKHSIICNFNPALDSMETVELMPIGLQVHARQTPQAGIPSPT